MSRPWDIYTHYFCRTNSRYHTVVCLLCPLFSSLREFFRQRAVSPHLFRRFFVLLWTCELSLEWTGASLPQTCWSCHSILQGHCLFWLLCWELLHRYSILQLRTSVEFFCFPSKLPHRCLRSSQLTAGSFCWCSLLAVSSSQHRRRQLVKMPDREASWHWIGKFRLLNKVFGDQNFALEFLYRSTLSFLGK